MTEDENEELELDLEEEEDLSPEGILLFSTQPGPRLFTLNDGHMTVIAGIMLEETDDSFLVGLPARIVQTDANRYDVIPHSTSPYSRLLKSATMVVEYITGVFEVCYMDYVREKGPEIFPQFSSYLETDAEDLEVNDAPADIAITSDEDIGIGKEAVGGNQVIGMSDEDLRIYLADKFNNGELLGVSRKKQ